MDGTSPKPPRMEESCRESQDSTRVVALTKKKKRKNSANTAYVNDSSLFLEPQGTQMYCTTESKNCTCFQVGSKHSDKVFIVVSNEDTDIETYRYF
jgi:hypothetical protein